MAVQYSQLLQQQQQFQMAGCGPAGNPATAAALFPQMMAFPAPHPTVFSEPESELTCNMSGSRKRVREDDPLPLLPTAATSATSALLAYNHHQQQQQLQQLLLLNSQVPQPCTKAVQPQPVDSARVVQSAMTSTSGRPMAQQQQQQTSPAVSSIISNGNAAAPVGTSPSAPSSLISLLHYQSLEVDALVRLHAENLRAGLEEARKRQCRAVVAAIGQQAQRRVAEKQAELDAAVRRNAELEERLRQAAAESQAWFNVARNSEALVASLRASLEQALIQKLNGDGGNAGGEIEGYGDSEDEAVSRAAAGSVAPVPCAGFQCAEQTSNPADAARKQPSSSSPAFGAPRCRSCGASDACVLVLPCRHLCLCRSCEPSVGDCPVCNGRKNGSLQISLS